MTSYLRMMEQFNIGEFLFFDIFKCSFICFFINFVDQRDQRPRRRRRNRNRPYGNGSAASGTETDNSVSNYRPSGGRPSQFQNDTSSNLVNVVKTEPTKVKSEPDSKLSGPSKEENSDKTNSVKSSSPSSKPQRKPPPSREQRKPPGQQQKYPPSARNGTSGSESDSKVGRKVNTTSSKPKEQIVNGEWRHRLRSVDARLSGQGSGPGYHSWYFFILHRRVLYCLYIQHVNL